MYEYLKLKDANTPKFEASKKEFLKHKGVLGFIFPQKRQRGYKIRFNAQCESIEIEHEIRSFLEVINIELRECADILFTYKTRWNKFVLPTGIDTKDSYGKNYQYGQYMFTVEQDKAFKLFTGENLYNDKTVFVRELLQNAIDTVLYRQFHRGSTDELKVKITTWTDDEHYQWFRVDDDGMGMDEEKIRKYFLKAGESFYTSPEFENEIDKYKEKHVGSFKPISRFGIGVLSCFLAGDRIEVSTLAHNSKSVRLSMSAGKKYFTTQIEEKGHKADLMPTRPGENPIGYRNKYGTSIAVRVMSYQHEDLGVEDLNFEKTVDKYVMYPPVPIYLNNKSFLMEENFLNTVSNVDILEFPIPELVIERVKQEYRVTIHKGAFVKIGFLNLSNYVSEQNKELLKGALFLAKGCRLSYTDDFYEKNKIEDERAKATLDVGIVNHRVQLILRRESYFHGLHDLPVKEQKWFSTQYRKRSEHAQYVDYDYDVNKGSNSDIGIDMNSYDWYKDHLSQLVNGDYSRLTPKFAHNGITYFYGTDRYREHFSSDCAPILLCHDSYRPELSVSREEVQSLPLEMDSEVNLAIRKALDEFSGNAELSKDTIDKSFVDFISTRQGRFSPSSTTANEICKLSNFDVEMGWYEYYSSHLLAIDQIDKELVLHPTTLPGIIYGTLIQKYKQCRLVKNGDKKYDLVIKDSTTIDDNSIIDNYYPPLFFLPVDNDDSLFVKYSYSRGFINLHNSDAKRIIAITEALYSRYPALFRAFVSTVYDGRIYDLKDLFNKIKGLPLWKNL